MRRFTWRRQLLHGFLGDVRHEADDGEDDEAGKHAGAGVDAAHDDGVPVHAGTKQTVFQRGRNKQTDNDGGNLLVHVVVVGVVAAQRDERAQAQAVGEEDLSGCIQPHLRGGEKQTNMRQRRLLLGFTKK